MSTWIDFKALRAKLDFEAVLQHYKIEVKRKGDQHMGFCPLPKHNGQKKSISFSANLQRGVFHCFGCGAKGNIFEFAAMMDGIDLKNGNAMREVALKLQNVFCPELGGFPKLEKSSVPTQAEKSPPKNDLPRLVNVPLNFELKGLDPNHPYLLTRGFTTDTVKQFGVGYCSRGYHKDRIAIPLHDHSGQLVGYAGRVVDDSKITEDNPRYKFPGDRKHDGKIFEFRKTLFLYNGFRIKEPLSDLIVVESFTSVWWLTQNDISNLVGTMGADCSEKQGELIVSLVKPGGRVWIVGDGDDAGDRHATNVMHEVARHRFVRWLRMPDDKQPTDFSKEELKMKFVE